MRDKPKLVVAVLAVVSLAAGLLVGGFWMGEPSRLVILSVGQGDCAVLQDSGLTVLIDAGPATSNSDAGERLVAPKLRDLGVDSIDLLLISHPDADHIGGLPGLTRRIPVRAVMIPACFKGHPAIRRLAAGPLSKTRILWLGRSSKASVGNFRLHLDAPFTTQPAADNDGSMFVRLASGKASAIFSGDAGMDVERRMIPVFGKPGAQVLHTGHHGSRTATSSAWLAAVRPQWVAISCGRNNRYGHPHESVLENIRLVGARVARTDREGDLVFNVEDSGFVRR